MNKIRLELGFTFEARRFDIGSSISDMSGFRLVPLQLADEQDRLELGFTFEARCSDVGSSVSDMSRFRLVPVGSSVSDMSQFPVPTRTGGLHSDFLTRPGWTVPTLTAGLRSNFPTRPSQSLRTLVARYIVMAEILMFLPKKSPRI
ncbi:hypothetical protein ACH5RR_038146 [Cinchona calisaya]|uniref:Uncharacterized protein n=1 Tax=Cinchona calisaya TaxID=153742 RepID=A0ABD2Y8B0_9GENT